MSVASRSAIRTDAQPFGPDDTARIKAEFLRDGYRMIPGVLAMDEVRALRAAVDRVFADPGPPGRLKIYGSFVAVRLFEDDPVFEDLLTREPIISLIEEILGKDCHLVANNVVRNAPGQAIEQYHADDLVFFPVAEGMKQHDARLTMPAFICTVQILLTDVPSVEYGPTQFIPGSHYAGRQPDDSTSPAFDGRAPVSMLGNAGDIYLHNGQCWHRGAPNTSNRTRYLLQLSYGMRFVSQRFYPFVNYQIPQHVLARADDRRKRVLGFHPKGAYG